MITAGWVRGHERWWRVGAWRGAGPTATGGYATAWLDLRAAADAAARSADLAGRLATWLAGADPDQGRAPVAPAHRLVDVGAGAGSMPLWLAPRLPPGQHWTLLEPDPALLATAACRVAAAEGVAARHDAGQPAGGRRPPRGGRRHLLRAARRADRCRPGPPRGPRRRRPRGGARGAHRHRRRRPRPAAPGRPHRHGCPRRPPAPDRSRGRGDAAPHRAARAAGWRVRSADTPWRLGPRTPELLRRWLDGFAAAAAEQDPAAGAHAWHRDRVAAAVAGRLRVAVGHVDVLALPPPGRDADGAP